MKPVTKMLLSAVGVSAAGLLGAGAAFGRFTQHPPVPRRKDGVKHAACIGDSITFGAGVIPRQRTCAWPAVLQRRLGEGWQVLNYGLSGRTLLSSGDMPYIREKFFPETIRCRADIYIIMLGTNDSKPYNWNAAEYERELELFLAKYTAVDGARVIVMRPSKCFVVEGAAEVGYDILNEHIEEELPIIDRVAARLQIETVDLYSFTERHPEWFDDGVHPNDAGNEAFAEYLYKQIFAGEAALE